MSDEGFDFRRQPERREAKQFEPPPWERDAFEELQRRKDEQEGPETDPAASASQEPAQPVSERDEGSEEAAPLGAASRPQGGSGGVDEAQMMELMAGLAAEEPPAERGYFPVAMGSALFMSALGAILLVWGVAALVGARRTGAVGTFAGTGLGLFGAGFLAAGIWMAYQALKRRGVL